MRSRAPWFWLSLALAAALGLARPAIGGDPSPLPAPKADTPPAPPAAPPAPSGPAAPASPSAPTAPADPLLIGVFEHKDWTPEEWVVDGDTIRLGKPHGNVRVIGLDAEEIFHRNADREASAKDFGAYAKAKKASSPVPVKYATPLGEQAKAYVLKQFEGVTAVRLERDEADQSADAYGRILAHVLYADREGKEHLLAEQVIREGLAPYFVKYGRSRRFDERFRAAQEAARAEKKGIWSEGGNHYDDYPARLAWWEERAKQVDQWIADVEGKPARATHVRLGVASDTARLGGLLGQKVTLFGSLDHVEIGKDAWPVRDANGAPTGEEPPKKPGVVKRVFLVDRFRDPFPVIVKDDAVWDAIDKARLSRNFVRASGVLSEYRGRLQIVIEAASDIRVQ